MQRHRELAAGKDHSASSLRLNLERVPCVRSRHLARLAFDLRAEQHAVVACCTRRALDGTQDFAGPHRQRERCVGENRVAGLRRLIGRIGECAPDCLGRVEVILRQHGSRARKRARVGHGRPRANHRRVVSWHVGDGDARQPCRIRVLRKPSAFDAREMLAHGVHLVDCGAGCEQPACHVLFVAQRKPGSRRNPIRGRAAGNERDHHILVSCGIGRRERLTRRCEARLIGDGVPRFDDPDDAGRGTITASGHGDAAQPRGGNTAFVEIMAFRSGSH